ncbi:hypothetical protein TNCT_585081 [Trichonephila clavata]|uniref:Uncharacterized protein n=1 Tax=Trichonephila clavata TaxID=2740835 RepID=A0A8X6LDA1_TRICU|nr:hypothetical protein TNCT_585081 [Trichonephila clavata]
MSGNEEISTIHVILNPPAAATEIAVRKRTKKDTLTVPQAMFILSMVTSLIMIVIDIKLKNPHIALTVIAGIFFVVGLVGCCYVKIYDK